MSLLNITNDGLPNILLSLHSILLRSSKPIAEDDLLDFAAPASIVEDDGQMVKNTLNRWTELGMFVRENGVISVKEKMQSKNFTTPEVLSFTRKMACKLSLAEENNPDIWASQSARSADLTRSLAWIMSQDVYRASFNQFEAQESQQIVDPDRQLMRNATRKAGLQYWAPFLGFSRHPYAAIDPTVAIRDALDDVLVKGEGMPATSFVSRLGSVLPVLDGGRWQLEVLQFVNPTFLPKLQQGQLSTALSRALLNLWSTGELLLQNKADLGDSIILTGVNGTRSDLTFQWVTRPKKVGQL